MFEGRQPASEGPLVGVCPCVLLQVTPGGEEPRTGGLPAVEGVAWEVPCHEGGAWRAPLCSRLWAVSL